MKAEVLEEIVRLYSEEHLSTKAIAARLNLSQSYVHRKLSQTVGPVSRPETRTRPLCRICNSPVKRKQSVYCSFTCMGKAQKERSRIQGTTDPRALKAMLVETRGHQCENCHLTDWQNVPIPLELEHVNGNHTDNSLTNLKLLCPNCHALTPTYKAKNKGNGRAHRRKGGCSTS